MNEKNNITDQSVRDLTSALYIEDDTIARGKRELLLMVGLLGVLAIVFLSAVIALVVL